MAEIAKSSTGLSGEYFVAAELYRRGWSVGMTVGNAKAIDLFAEKDGKNIAIQVKAIFKRKHNTWPMPAEVKKDCYYIFVCLNGDTMALPDFYVASTEEAQYALRIYKGRGAVTIASLNSTNFLNNWGKLEHAPIGPAPSR